MMRGDNLQSIIDLISMKITNPFTLLDKNSFILGRSKGYEMITAGTIWDNMKGNYLNLYDFYSPEEWNTLRIRIHDAGRGYILYNPEKDPVHTYFSISLFDGDLQIGSIGAMDNRTPFSQAQLHLLSMARDLLELYFHTSYNASRSENVLTASFDHFLNHTGDLNALLKSLNIKHWNEKDSFFLLTFDFADIIESEMEMTAALNLIHLQFTNAMLGIKNKQMVLICRKRDYDFRDPRKKASLLQFLKKYDLYCGKSYEFDGFMNAVFYSEQSGYAARWGIQNGQRFTEYKDVHITHVINSLKNTWHTMPALSGKEDLVISPEDYPAQGLMQCCHPMIWHLSRSKKESDRILVSCLKAYLINGRSISQTCRSLNIHRNTLIYRIDRLESLLEIHFEDLSDDEIMSLIFSCYIALY